MQKNSPTKLRTLSKGLHLAFAISLAFAPVMMTSVHAQAAQTQQMDAQLNMAKRNIEQIQKSLATIRTGDVAQYNKLSKQLTKAADLLKATSSQAHPDFQIAVQNWSTLRSQMVSMSEQWQQAQANANFQQNNSQGNSVNNNQTAMSASAQSNAQASGQVVNANAILAKYQRENRPKLSNYPNPSDVSNWARSMKALQSTELQADLRSLQDASVSAQDRQRVSNWIGGSFQDQITQDISNAMQHFNNLANTAAQTSQQIMGIDQSDKMRIYNFANGESGRRNMQRIDAGLVASANALALEESYPSLANPERQQQIALLATAQQTLQEYSEVAKEQAEVLANMPKKQKKKNEQFLKGISQTLWFKGSEFASLDSKGSIWMNSEDVGDIVNSGTIYVFSRDIGSIEPDGKVWFNGNHVGILEENGKVWRNGTHVGTVEPNGKVWIDGGQNGEIVPYDGEWKRAAVVYFFNDWFTRDAWKR
ncbi:hypothetical protein PN836_004615 [Ningiella sp. W23]|uniref:hypothetical protein n=1 Tax=Ningiella sp. W23 TaxID=3023715 RepID=UPI0037576DE1